MTLRLVGEPEADQLLDSNPLALLIGMLLDQQYPMEAAFAGPRKLAGRIESFDAATIAACDPEEFAELCTVTPAVHRYPGSMAKRIQAVCAHIVAEYDGDAAGLWTVGEPTGPALLQRLKALPGFGDQKARIFLALLGKQRGIQPDGWREAAGAYGEEGSRRSIADVTDDRSLAEVRDFKKQAKAAAKK
ncbi:MAG: Fe-S cluster assembly protein HesB [Actinomycetota bacterium]|nr:Fe-S cluster assembly protein HesB [Actinomycetota bacterium]